MKISVNAMVVWIVLAGFPVKAVEIPAEIASAIHDVRANSGTVQAGMSKELGFFLVGVGRAGYRPDNVRLSRELAEIDLKKQLAGALNTAVEAHDVASLEMTVSDEEKATASAFVSSLTEATIKGLLKGVQIAGAGKNAGDEMEVFGFLTAKLADRTGELVKDQMKWGDKGVVQAVGIDVKRNMAEKNALRSAVEQVAGTLVVGKVSVNEKEDFRKRLATTATALVEEYRVTRESKIDLEYHVEVLARVDKRKLYDNYRSYFKCLDNPVFCLIATDDALRRNFHQFFVDKGFALTNNREEAHYLIRLDGRFFDRPTPMIPGSTGTMLDLKISIDATDGSRTLLVMNEKQSKDSAVLTPELRRLEVSRRIFNKLEPRLHKAIQDMVVRMLDEVDVEPEESLDDSGVKF